MAVNPNNILRSYPAASSSKQLMNAAALDIAFDVFLAGMRERDLFEACDIVFKGGTALRKFRLGHKSRFSFDLDFAIADGGEDILVEEMTGYDHEGFKFNFIERRGHHLLLIESPLFTDAAVSTKIDFSNRPCWLPPDELLPISSPALPSGIWGSATTVPNMRLEENVAEKLARWQSRRLVRDLYDLAAVSNRIDDMSLVARMYVLKSHRNWSSALPSRRPPQAASLLSRLTSDALISSFELDDLVLAATVSDSDKRTQLRNDLALVSYMAESVDQHILGTDGELHRWLQVNGGELHRWLQVNGHDDRCQHMQPTDGGVQYGSEAEFG